MCAEKDSPATVPVGTYVIGRHTRRLGKVIGYDTGYSSIYYCIEWFCYPASKTDVRPSTNLRRATQGDVAAYRRAQSSESLGTHGVDVLENQELAREIDAMSLLADSSLILDIIIS